ncbi:hypothetical protein MBLNU230_g3084t1 [Neophaeotheca triangularis]
MPQQPDEAVAESSQRYARSPKTVQDTAESESIRPALDEDVAQVHYTALIRLPFPRGDFQEPEQVSWDASKDAALWSLISSKGSNPKDLDWQKISEKFEVNLSFLMMQAAWLYERHFEGVRKQMAMLGGVAGGVQADGEQKKVTQSRVFTPTSKQSTGRHFRSSGSYQRRPRQPVKDPSDSSPDDPENEQIESSKQEGKGQDQIATDGKAPVQSRLEGKRPSVPSRSAISSNDGSLDNDEDDEASSSGGFLPFAAGSKISKGTAKTTTDPTATLRDSSKRQQRTPIPHATQIPGDSSASSASSTQQPVAPSTSDPDRKAPGPLSPKQRAKLAQQMSPRHRREGDSEGTPSMGSSFSDLDDASVTRSALEDALMSNMQGNASLASRVSGIGNAFRSRYS